MAGSTSSPRPGRIVLGPPVVVERPDADRAGRKRRRPAERAEHRLVRVAQRTVEAGDVALRRYEKERRRSSRREKDGAVVDLVPNATRAAVAGSAKLAVVPLDLLRAVPPKTMRRASRRSLRAATRMLDRS